MINKTNLLSFIKQILIYIATGMVCGVVGTLFSKGVTLVSTLRSNNPWLLYLLPLAGILSVALYQSLKVSGVGTNQVIASAQNKNLLSPKLAPAIFGASLLSHLCGASVGREGAALQLGGSSASFLSKRFHLNAQEEKILLYCGMAGVFSSVFGTPLAAAVFALEVVFVGKLFYKAIAPVFLTSLVSYFTATALGVHAEQFALTTTPQWSFTVVWKVLVLGLLTVAVSFLFCFSLKYTEKWVKALFKNPFVRAAVGGIVIIALTLAVGTRDYNGAGVGVIEAIFSHNQFEPFAFALKLLFTCLCVAAGFKGGEIVPTLFIGATFGALAGSLLGLPVAFAAAVCMISLFCGVTNCPLASILLAAELFSGKALGFIAIATLLCFCLSGKISLYTTQKARGFKNWF